MGVLSDTKSVTGGDTVHVTFTSSLIQDQGHFKIEFSIGKKLFWFKLSVKMHLICLSFKYMVIKP